MVHEADVVTENAVHNDLIFDFGVNRGEETEFYLLKGFRVLGVELMNPLIFSRSRTRWPTNCFD